MPQLSGRATAEELDLYAAERVANHPRVGDARMTEEELGLWLDVEAAGFRLTGANLGMGAAAQPKAKGPMWFRKMDRNGDGDLSLREWKGSEEDFRRYDADGDGLVSAEEAERLEKKTGP